MSGDHEAECPHGWRGCVFKQSGDTPTSGDDIAMHLRECAYEALNPILTKYEETITELMTSKEEQELQITTLLQKQMEWNTEREKLLEERDHAEALVIAMKNDTIHTSVRCEQLEQDNLRYLRNQVDKYVKLQLALEEERDRYDELWKEHQILMHQAKNFDPFLGQKVMVLERSLQQLSDDYFKLKNQNANFKTQGIEYETRIRELQNQLDDAITTPMKAQLDRMSLDESLEVLSSHQSEMDTSKQEMDETMQKANVFIGVLNEWERDATPSRQSSRDSWCTDSDGGVGGLDDSGRSGGSSSMHRPGGSRRFSQRLSTQSISIDAMLEDFQNQLRTEIRETERRLSAKVAPIETSSDALKGTPSGTDVQTDTVTTAAVSTDAAET
eukprot:GFYU01000638.1.p1 GENE.GFYU01000638.1~~GFYU01000638.1.p1  ORF type:complete len:392 (-),score=107.74 GFYU01000638.1:254-1408(-)